MILVSNNACESKQEKARNNLKSLNIEFTPNSFVESAKNGDIVAVDNFLDAGMNPDVKNNAGCSAMFYAETLINEKMKALLKEHGSKVNLDRILGTWVCENPNFSNVKLYKENGKYYYQTTAATYKADLKNDNTLVFPLVIPKFGRSGSLPPHIITIEVELRENDMLAVTNIFDEPVIFKRLSK